MRLFPSKSGKKAMLKQEWGMDGPGHLRSPVFIDKVCTQIARRTFEPRLLHYVSTLAG